MTRKLRSMTAVVMSVSMAAVLTACFPVGSAPAPAPPPSDASAAPGLSREAAAELLNAVPGLRNGEVGSVISGLTTEAIVEVSVDDETSIMAEGVLDYVLRVGWATAATRKPTQLSLTVWNKGTRLDLQDEANALAGVKYSAIPSLYSVHMDEPTYLGVWPGAVPPPPAG